MRKPKLLLIADVPNWIFERHCLMLKRYLSDDFEISIVYDHQPFREAEYDLIYPLEWYKVQPDRIDDPSRYVTAVRSHLVWTERDFTKVTALLQGSFNLVHVVSKRLYDIFSPHLGNLRYVSHGVDTSFFTPSTYSDQSGHILKLGWAGNRNSVGRKGFTQFIEELGKVPGVQLRFCGYSDCNLSLAQMRLFYDALDAYICASDYEGNNNSLLEAAAMARAIITTDNGTVPEYLENGRSALIVERNAEAFRRAVMDLRDDPAKRKQLGIEARQAVLRKWNWQERAEDYRHFFREALERRDVVKGSLEGKGKVLIACTHFWPSVGGVETMAAGLGEGLASRGYGVDVATLAHPQRSSRCHRGTKIISLDAGEILDNKPLWPTRLRNLVCSGRYRACILIADPLNELIWSVENAEIPPQTRLLIQPVINMDGFRSWKADGTFRSRLASILKKAIPLSLSRSGAEAEFLAEERLQPQLIPNAVAPPPAQGDFRERYGIPRCSFLILHLANLWKVKNHIGLLRAIGDLPEEYQLVLVGYPSPDQEYLGELQRELKAHPRVLVIPGLPAAETASALAAADLLVLASHGEVSPVSVLEAMAHGVPWLATPECGAVNEQVGGVVVPLKQFCGVIRFLSGNSVIRQRLGELGHRQWQSSLSWQVVLPMWEEVIEKGELKTRPIVPADVIAEQRAIKDTIARHLALGEARPRPGIAAANPSHRCEGVPRPSSCSPLVSVIVPTYNRPEMLKKAVESVLQQTLQEVEMIVINDAGCDVASVLNSFRSPRIRYLTHERNKGLAAARNTGIRAARGKYLAYLDDDDIFYSDHLLSLSGFLEENPEIKVAYSDANRAHLRMLNDEWVTVERDQPFSCDFDYDRILHENFIPVLCVLHHRSCFEKVDMFDENLKRTEDWDLWLRLSRHFRFAHVRKTTCEYTLRPGSSGMIAGRPEPFDWAALHMFHKYRSYTEDRVEIRTEHERKVADALDRLVASLTRETGKPEAGKSVAELLCLKSVAEAVQEATVLMPLYPAEHGRFEKLISLLRGMAEQAPPAPPTSASDMEAGEVGPRLIAFHLPQYHRIPENDAWWGEGFTEWTNVVKGAPRFTGHYQPHVPSELGYYDLEDPAVLTAQADLARRYGIHGFCFYHYWFDGKLMLEAPLHRMLQSQEPRFPFCLCWANEDWTRAWDGRSGEKLVSQTYSHQDDIRHFHYLAAFLADRRYLRVGGKPLLLVYRANLLPDPLATSQTWRRLARKVGMGELYLCRVESFSDEHGDPSEIGFDASVEFQPDWRLLTQPLQDERFGTHAVFDYADVVGRMLRKEMPCYKRFPCVTPSWDNSARRRENATVVVGSTPDLYQNWLTEVIARSKPVDAEEHIVFINAWNEWGEGNHLEPDRRHGRRYLIATRNAVRCAQQGGVAKETPCAAVMASIVIPVFNKVELTRQCLEAIDRNGSVISYEIVVVDNGSSDGTRDYLQSLAMPLTILRNADNLGFTAATNQGAAAAKGKYLVFLNNDTVPQPGWLESLVGLPEEDPSIGAVGAKLLYPDGRLQEAGALIFSDGNGWNFGNGDDPDKPQYNIACEVDYCSGACLLVRRDAFVALGGLDERYSPAYYEETDLCFGLRILGYKVMYHPNAVVVHYGSATAGAGAGTGFKQYLQINRVKFVDKWRKELLLQDPPPHISGRNPVTADRKRLLQGGKQQGAALHKSAAFRKAVVFFPHNPYPPATGAHQRCLGIIEALRECGCSVTLASSDLFSETPWPQGEIPYLEHNAGIAIHVYRGTPTDVAYISQCRAGNGELVNWDFYAPPGLRADFAELCGELQPEIVVINYAYWGSLISNPGCQRAVKIIDTHDLLTVNMKMKLVLSRYLPQGTLDAASVDPALLDERLFDGVDVEIGEKEAEICDRFDYAVAISSKDQEALSRRLHQAKAVNIPMAFTPAATVNSYSGGPVFVISDNPFNLQGYLYFTARVLPDVLREIPQLTVNVVGRGSLRVGAAPGVKLLGFVPDLKPLYAESRFAICPLLGGTGQQVKIVEAMAHGVPVIALAAVAATSPIRHGVNGFIAADAKEFASYVIRLYKEPGLAERLGRGARATIEEQFSKESVSSKLKEILTPPGRIAGGDSLAPQPRHILWIRTDSIGDTVLAASMLPHLKGKFPDARLTVACQQHVAELYQSSPFVDSIIPFDRLRWCQDETYRCEVARRVRDQKGDLCLNSVYSRDAVCDLLSFESGARERVALDGDLCNITAEMRDKCNRLYTRIIASEGEWKPELDRHRDFLAGLGIAVPRLEPMLWSTAADEAFADDFFRLNGVAPERSIALFAGAQSQQRTYPHYGKALAAQGREAGFTVIAFGIAADHELNRVNLAECGMPAYNLCGKLSLRQVAAILKRCRLAIGAETGTAHIACAVGTPNVVLVGGGHFGRFMPYSPLTTVVSLPLGCYRCNWRCKHQRAHCVKDIHPEVVAQAVRQTLLSSSEKARVFCQAADLWAPVAGEPQWMSCEPLLRHHPFDISYVGTAPCREAAPYQEKEPAQKVMASPP